MFVDGVGVVENMAIVANGGWQGKLKAKYSPPAPLLCRYCVYHRKTVGSTHTQLLQLIGLSVQNSISKLDINESASHSF